MSDRQAFHRHLQSRGIPSDLFQQDESGAYEFPTVEHDWQVWSAAIACAAPTPVGETARAAAAIALLETLGCEWPGPNASQWKVPAGAFSTPVGEVPAGQACGWCTGTGKFADHNCRFCNGKGAGSVFVSPAPAASKGAEE